MTLLSTEGKSWSSAFPADATGSRVAAHLGGVHPAGELEIEAVDAPRLDINLQLGLGVVTARDCFGIEVFLIDFLAGGLGRVDDDAVGSGKRPVGPKDRIVPFLNFGAGGRSGAVVGYEGNRAVLKRLTID